MPTLHDRVGSYGTDQTLMADLANSCGTGSTEAAARAYDIALPAVLEGFSNTARMKVGATLLHTLAAQLSRTERDHPGTLFGSSDHPLRRVVVDQVFGSSLPSVQADVARAASLGTADRLIEITSLVCLAAAAGSGETAVGLPAFVAAVGAAGSAPVPPPPPGTATPTVAPTAVLPAATPVPATPTAPDPLVSAPASALMAPSPGTAPVALTPPLAAPPGITDPPDGPLVDKEERSRWPWLLAAAAAALLLIGAISVLGGGDDLGDTEAAPVTNATAEPSEGEPEAVVPVTDVAESVATEPVPTEPVAIEPPSTDAVETESVELEPPEAAEGADTAIDFASLAEDPDVEVMSIPMRDIADPDRDASGVLETSFDKVTGEVCYSVTSDGITGPYSAHIHAGDFGVKGGIVVDLGQLQSGDSRCIENLPVDTNAILANPAGHYAEIHDAGNEWTLRGQLTERVVGDIVTISVPMKDAKAVNPDAEGLITFDFNTVTGEICFAVESTDVAGPYSSHIHVGPVGVKGGIVVELGKLDNGDAECVDNLPVDTNAILSDPAEHYAELHDTSEEWTVRGQLSNTVATGAGSGDESGTEASSPAENAQVDADGGGAFIRLDKGTIFLEGAVADQATADGLANSLSNVDAGTPVVNNLTVEAGAPLPSGRIVIADAIFFGSDSSQIQEIDAETLVAITALAKSQPGAVLTVVGHTDDRGSDVGNLELSLRRATASRDLLAELDLPEENLRIRGAGETAPIGDNATAEGRALNRRIEFELAPPA